jgi:hypothetical protein
MMKELVVMTGILVMAFLLACHGPPSAVSPGTSDPLLSLVKGPAGKSIPKLPWGYEGFEKRILEMDGKSVIDIIAEKDVTSFRLQDYEFGPRKGKSHYRGPDFVAALRTGKIVRDEQAIIYHLQWSEECFIETRKGEYRIGIFYPPVGYLVFPNGECYWFFFKLDKQ